LVALGVVVVVASSFFLPGLLGSKPVQNAQALAAGVAQGRGLPPGTTMPTFVGHDVVTGHEITSQSIYDQKTLLFFSEGVNCQACLEQIKGLQQVGSQLSAQGIKLVSITPDSADILRQAVTDYGITTPVISDSALTMSEAFNTLGLGMHGNTPGHAFFLVYHGKVLWYRDYWLTNQSMYVQPSTLLAELPTSPDHS
jgi:peroxiredoxin